MTKKTGLGKGLGALINTSIPEVIEEVQIGEKIQNVKIIEIEPNREQPRKIFDEESIEELAKSIKQYGIIQPIIVTKKTDYYQIVAGERRWRASKKAGLTEMPVIIRDYDEKKKSEIALIENIQREDLNPIEKARAIKELIDRYQLTQQEVGEALGMGRSTVANTIRLLNLDQRVIDLALEGKLTEGHCRPLLAIENPDEQYKTALKFIQAGDSVREIEKKVRKTKVGMGDKKQEILNKDIENKFRDFFGTKVVLSAGQKKGKIVIEYSSNDELDRILELIK